MLTPTSNITINGCSLKLGHPITYLRSTVSSLVSLDAEVSSRIAKATSIMAKLNRRMWSSNHLAENTKLHTYQACVINRLLFDSETWTVYANQEKRLSSFHLYCPRHILHIPWQDRMHNTEVLKCTAIQSLFAFLSQRCLRWLAHVCQIDSGQITEDIL